MTQNNTRKSKAIEALGVGLSVSEASSQAGVSRNTVYRWLDDGDFQGAVSERQKSVLEQVEKRLSGLALQGLETLEDLMGSENENIKLRASSAVLSRFTEILEVLGLEGRIEALENDANKR